MFYYDWILVIIITCIIYPYLVYPLLLLLITSIKRFFSSKSNYDLSSDDFEPSITLMIAAYNEKELIEEKITNCKQLIYPKEKLQIIIITDGSDDGTPDIIAKHKEIKLLNQPARNGKIGAINRGMQYVNTPIVVFSDANTMLGKNTLKKIVEPFKDKKVGCVSGEKRILFQNADTASGAGEGFYWRYESFLKKLDSDFNSAVGAAGELFAIQTEYFQEVEPDTILDDFVISLRIALKGKKIKYTPEAYAIESASFNIEEEMKRKIRIAAGCFQTLFRLKQLFNIFKHPMLTFQYLSHKVWRWTLAPLALFLLFPVTLILKFNTVEGNSNSLFFSTIFIFEIIIILLFCLGLIFRNTKIKFTILFGPYYFISTNYALFAGFVRFLRKKQSVRWEKAKRAYS